MNLGVLVSGRGSNLQAILDATELGGLAGVARVAVVISNRPGAPALDRARASGVPAEVVDHRAFPSRETFEQALVERLDAHCVELVCLAGFMRVLTPAFLRRFPDRIVNIHPSLLPAFPGVDAQAQALAHGVKIAGCTVHFVDESLDAGPIIAQAAVPVLDGDDAAALSRRILDEEHRIYPTAISLVARGRVARDGRRVRVQGGGAGAPALRNPDVTPASP